MQPPVPLQPYATLHAQAGSNGSQRLGVGNAFGMRDCSSVPSRGVAVVCPRLSACGGLSCSRHVGWCVDGDGDGCGCVKFTVGELVGLALREVDGGLSCGGHVGGWRGKEGGANHLRPIAAHFFEGSPNQ